jgi:hypothetical protein
MNKTVRKIKLVPPVASDKEKPSATFKFKNWWSRAFGVRSIVVAIVGGLFLYKGISMDNGYRWVWENLLKGNWKYIQVHRRASIEKRNQMKLGFDYDYLNYIKKNTPEDAIILFPSKTHITEQSGKQKLSHNINSKSWVTHFIYPRTALYKDEKETNPLYDKVTHIAIIAGHGYEDLEYTVKEIQAFIVLPKKMPRLLK